MDKGSPLMTYRSRAHIDSYNTNISNLNFLKNYVDTLDSPVDFNLPSFILEGSADLLASGGAWLQNLLWDGKGGYCLLGAVLHTMYQSRLESGSMQGRSRAANASIPILAKYLGYQQKEDMYDNYVGARVYIARWNNYPDRTREEAIMALRGAARLARDIERQETELAKMENDIASYEPCQVVDISAGKRQSAVLA